MPRTRREPGGAAHRVATVLAVVLVAALVAVLLWPDGFAVNRAVVRVYVFFLDLGMPHWVTPDVYAVLLNVLVFATFGWLGVALLRWPPLRVVLVLVAFSVGVELFQALPGVARDPSVVDVACNSLGAVLGVLGASVVGRHRHHGRGAEGDQPGLEQPLDERRDVGGDRLEG